MSITAFTAPFAIDSIGTRQIVGAPVITALTDGRFVAVWAETLVSPADEFLDTDGAVFARIYSADGVPAGDAVQVNSWQPGAQFDPSVAATDNGGFAVSWISASQWGDTPAETDAFLATFDAQGVRLLVDGSNWDFIDLLPDTPPPFLSTDAQGTFIEGLGDGLIGAVVKGGLDGDIVLIRDSVATLATTTKLAFDVTGITRLKGGNILLSGLTDEGRAIFQLSDASLIGAPAGIPGLDPLIPVRFYVATTTFPGSISVTALSPGAFAPNPSAPGGFAVTMIRNHGVAGSDLVVSTFTAWGTETGRFIFGTGLALDQAVDGGFDTIALPDGTLVIAFTMRDADGRGIGVQHLDANATALGAPVFVHPLQIGDQDQPQLAVLEDGSVIVSYLDNSGSLIEGLPSAMRAVHVSLESGSSANPPTEGNDLLYGTGANDAIDSLGGNDTVDGGSGNDALFGNAGNDRLSGNLGNDALDGGAGGDLLSGDDGDDGLSGAGGFDRLIGGAGADALNGGFGDDTLYGGAGADRLHGSVGDDLLDGGRGADVFVMRAGGGTDIIADFGSDDVLRLERSLWSDAGNLTRGQVINRFATVDGADLVFHFTGGEILRLENVLSLTASDLQLI